MTRGQKAQIKGRAVADEVGAPIEVTSENFGDLLVRGAMEAVAVARGELEPARVRMLTAQEVSAKAPPVFDGAMIKQLRGRLGLSQEVFAQVIFSTPSAVRSWEQDQRQPDGPTRRLLEIAAEEPHLVLGKLEQRIPNTGGRSAERTVALPIGGRSAGPTVAPPSRARKAQPTVSAPGKRGATIPGK